MRTAYFEGWYFRHQWADKTLALIPARHRDAGGQETATLQIITENGSDCVRYAPEAFRLERRPFRVRLGENAFGPEGCRLDCTFRGQPLRGQLRYGTSAPLGGDIMGPFRFMPGLECRHSVLSMAHEVTGELTLGGEHFSVQRGNGYAEGDHGSSFPSRYLWTQSTIPGGSLMLAAAEVPLRPGRFTGCLGAILLDGRETRLATYLGARVLALNARRAVVAQREWMLTTELLEARPRALRAPVRGSMTRTIRESAACRVRYRLTHGNRLCLDLVTDRAAFESDGL